ncbi:unnamed protein product [Cuscuta europaea]|uniref:RNase H type-1 domain-containing protein n=1 Tax=Cuscuta europaea TaxID=41803 RepID=A0A9P1ED53_CUSEU|nr:unnamed protein product [Cuscuta europaea]
MSSFEAELLAMVTAIRWTIDAGFVDFQVEIDAAEVLEYVFGKRTGRWTSSISSLMEMANRARLSYGHVLREGNWPTHLLVDTGVAHFKFFPTLISPPPIVKSAYYLDLFNFPSFRCLM